MLERLEGVLLPEVSYSQKQSEAFPDPTVLDVPVLLQQMDGDWDLVKDAANIFLGDCPHLLGSVRTALDTMNAEALEHAAHKLLGTLSQFAAPRAVEVARSLEHIARTGDLTGQSEILASLEREMDYFTAALSLCISGVHASGIDDLAIAKSGAQ